MSSLILEHMEDSVTILLVRGFCCPLDSSGWTLESKEDTAVKPHLSPWLGKFLRAQMVLSFRPWITVTKSVLRKAVWWVDPGWVPGAHQAALSLSFLSRTEREKIRQQKSLVCQDKGSLMKQKQRPLMESKENKRFILYFRYVQIPPGMQGVVALEDKWCNKKFHKFPFPSGLSIPDSVLDRVVTTPCVFLLDYIPGSSCNHCFALVFSVSASPWGYRKRQKRLSLGQWLLWPLSWPQGESAGKFPLSYELPEEVRGKARRSLRNSLTEGMKSNNLQAVGRYEE